MLAPPRPQHRRASVLAPAALVVLTSLVGVARPPAALAYPTANVEIDGHGFGHGRGMGQYGAIGYALAGWSYRQILGHYYSNTSVGDIGNPEVTVILRRFDTLDTVVTQEQGHLVTNAAGGAFRALRAVKTGTRFFRVEGAPDCGGPWTVVNPGMAEPVVFAPQVRSEDRTEMLQACEPGGARRWYRGEIRAVEGLDGTSRTVNALDVQGYLKGVVPRESPASWGDLGGGAGMHELRAQAVAARSYAQATTLAPYAKVDDTTATQAYGGRALQNADGFFDLEDGRSSRAVDDTLGEVRLLNGGVARTEYSSSTGGYTAGGTFPAVVDDGDAVSFNPHHSWHASIPVSQVEARYPTIGTLTAVTVTRRNGLGDFGGRALEVQVQGTRASTTVSGDSFAAALGLRSNWYAIAEAAPPAATPPPASSPPPRKPWGGPLAIRPDGRVLSSPDAAAVRGAERVDVVVRGTWGFFWTYWTGSGWTPWTDLGSPPSGYDGDPTIVSWAPGRLDVFVRGANDGKLWQRFSVDGGANWSEWIKPLGDDGVLVSSPQVSSRGPGRLDVWVLGTDGAVYQRFFDGWWNDRWIWLGQPPPGSSGGPTAASQDGGHVDIFLRGADAKLWQRSWNGQWSGWFQPVGNDGVLASSPDATSWGLGNLLVFVRGTDDGIYGLVYGNGRWSTWTRLGGPGDVTPDAPRVDTRGPGRFDVFVRGTDSLVWQLWI